MPAVSLLWVKHSQQLEYGYCLPACAQMVLDHLGISRSQRELARVFKVREGVGTAAYNILFLSIRRIKAHYQLKGTLDEIQQWLREGVPVIACVEAGELPHWRDFHFQHAVLIVGLEEGQIFLHDPALGNGPTIVPVEDFVLAWDEMQNA